MCQTNVLTFELTALDKRQLPALNPEYLAP